MEENLGIDEDLLNEAVRLGGHQTKAETVNAALREFVDRWRRQVVKMFGTVDYRPDYDYKKARRREFVVTPSVNLSVCDCETRLQ